jgi:hypothetical protein
VPATLKLRREATIAELHRGTFDVVVDGHGVSSIDMHGTIETPIDPGRHTLRVRDGRYSSRDLTFDVTDGEIATFRCNGARVWPIWLATFILSSRALWLHRD